MMRCKTLVETSFQKRLFVERFAEPDIDALGMDDSFVAHGHRFSLN